MLKTLNPKPEPHKFCKVPWRGGIKNTMRVFKEENFLILLLLTKASGSSG
jgi:hypothetical protein